MFRNLSFCIHNSKSLSSRHRIILSKLLQRHGGKVIDANAISQQQQQQLFHSNSPQQLPDYFIVGSTDESIEGVSQGKCRSKEWVSECVRNGRIIDVASGRKQSTSNNSRNYSTSTQNSSSTSTSSNAAPSKDDNSDSNSLHSQHTQQQKRLKRIKYACETPNTLDKADSQKESDFEMNHRIITQLERLKYYYHLLSDQWREFTLQKAVSVLKNHDKPITTVEDLNHIQPRLGEKTRKKVEEIIIKGKSSRLEHFEQDERIKVIEEFVNIWGVGGKTASAWYDNKHLRSLQELKDAVQEGRIKLSSQQQIGLKYYDDLQHRIPRDEVKKIDEYVRKEALKVNPHLKIVTAGSFRRGKPHSGDVDILITTTPDAPQHFPPNLLRELVKRLTEQGFITGALTESYDHNEQHSFMGVCKHPTASPYHRRIDLKVYRPEIYGFALLYFTGSDYFNRSMRLLAHRKGLSLSDKSLRPVVRKRGEKIVEGPCIPCDTEESIFAALGMEYRTPEERNVG